MAAQEQELIQNQQNPTSLLLELEQAVLLVEQAFAARQHGPLPQPGLVAGLVVVLAGVAVVVAEEERLPLVLPFHRWDLLLRNTVCARRHPRRSVCRH